MRPEPRDPRNVRAPGPRPRERAGRVPGRGRGGRPQRRRAPPPLLHVGLRADGELQRDRPAPRPRSAHGAGPGRSRRGWPTLQGADGEPEDTASSPPRRRPALDAGLRTPGPCPSWCASRRPVGGVMAIAGDGTLHGAIGRRSALADRPSTTATSAVSEASSNDTDDAHLAHHRTCPEVRARLRLGRRSRVAQPWALAGRVLARAPGRMRVRRASKTRGRCASAGRRRRPESRPRPLRLRRRRTRPGGPGHRARLVATGRVREVRHVDTLQYTSKLFRRSTPGLPRFVNRRPRCSAGSTTGSTSPGSTSASVWRSTS